MMLAYTVRSQSISQNPHTPLSDQAVCPGESTITYSVSGYGSCNIKWTITTNGQITTADNLKDVSVKWTDIPGTDTITATLSGCTGSSISLEGHAPSVSHVILSVNGQNFDPLGYNTNPRNIDFCTPAQVDLFVSHMYVPGTGGIAQPPLQEVSYEWTLPGGWKEVNTNATGTIISPVNIISIIPTKCAVPGNVIVKGVVGNCTAPDIQSKSNPATFVLNGVSPLLTIGPQAGYQGATFCNTTPVTFTTTLNYALGCISNYTWNFPANWHWRNSNNQLVSSPVTTTTNTIQKEQVLIKR